MLRGGNDWAGEHFAFDHGGASSQAPADAGGQHESIPVGIDNGPDGPSATISDSHLLFTAHFSQAGADLVLRGEDGKTFVVHDYFATEQRARLLSADGAALSPDVVAALAGPQAPGQYAQAGAPQAAAQAVGRVAVIDGSATIIRNGVAITPHVGDAVLKGDVLQTVTGALGVTFNDGSTLNLTANSRMVVNEFVYQPNGAQNSQLLNLVQGSLTFISGEVAHTGNMKIGTPVATMGIRGTVGGVTTANDGTVQFYVSQSATGAVIIDSSGAVIANVVQDGPLILVRPVGPLQVIAEEINKTPQQVATELAALQHIVSVQSVGQQIIQQFFQPNPNPNPQSTDQVHTQFQIDLHTNPTTTPENGGNNGGNGTHVPDSGTVTITPPQDQGSPTAPPLQPIVIEVPIPQNLAPINFGPLTATTDEDNALVFSNANQNAISVFDADSNVLTVTLTAMHGIVTLSGAAGLTFANGSNASAAMTISGTQAAINAALAGATFKPDQDYYGQASVTVVSSDGNSTTAPETVAITVNPVNDAPTVDLTPTIVKVPIPDPLPDGTDALAVQEIAPAMSNDGRWVAFFSDEQIPSVGDNSDKGDIFLYDRLTNTTTVLTDDAHLSVKQEGELFSGFSISGDGSNVVFRGEYQVADANSPTGFDDVSHIYVYNRGTDTVHLLNNPANDQPFTVNDDPHIAGGQIVFSSTDFGNNTSPPIRHIYVTDLTGHIQTDITLASLNIPDPNPGNPDDSIEFQQPDISGNGRYLTFWAVEKVFNPEDGTVTPVGDATLYTYDRASNTAQIIATSSGGNEANWWASMSNDGRHVVFQSDSNALDTQAGGVANNQMDIFVFDRETNTIIGVTDNADFQANGASYRATISANGGEIIFASVATNLVAGDTNGQGDTFVYDVASNTFTRISVASNGTQGNGDSTLGADISAGNYFQGVFAAFGSTANNLVPGDTNGTSDVFVVDRTGGIFGSVTEDNTTPAFTGAPAGSLSTHGAFNFSDVDLTDSHTVSVIGFASDTSKAPGFTVPGGGLGTFTPTIVEAPGGSGQGQVAWTFTVDNAAVQGLNGDQRVSEVYTVQIDDGHGGVVTQGVTIVIGGTPDAPGAPVIGTQLLSDSFDTENHGVNQGGFTAFHDFSVVGQTDLIGTGSSQDFYPGNGLYVDLRGSGTLPTTVLTSKTVYGPGTYTLTLDLAGPHRDSAGNSVSSDGVTDTTIVTFGNYTESFTPATGETLHIVREITIPPDSSASLVISDPGSSANGNIGNILFDVSVTSIDAVQATTYVENNDPVAINPALALSDVDSANLASATISLTNYQAGDLLSIAGVLPNGITTFGYNATTGALVLTGLASLAAYEIALHQIGFSSDNPSTADRVISVVVNDGAADSNALNSIVHVINDTPVVDLDSTQLGTGYATTVTNDDRMLAVFSDHVSVSDSDSLLLQSATVRLDYLGGVPGNYAEYTNWTERFSIDESALPGLTHNDETGYTLNGFGGLRWEVSSGGSGLLLNITGAADATTYAELLDAVRFSSHSSNLTDREISVTVSDGPNDSAVATAIVHLETPADQRPPGELVVNGGFELNLLDGTGAKQFSGWTLANATGNESLSDGPMYSGDYDAAIGSRHAETPVTLSQSISTTLDTHYTLSFWLRAGEDTGSPDNEIKVTWAGQTVRDLTNQLFTDSYTHHTIDVVGGAGQSTLQFASFDPTDYWRIDDVSVRAGAPNDEQEIASGTVSYVGGAGPHSAEVTADGGPYAGNFTIDTPTEPADAAPGSVGWHFALSNAELDALAPNSVATQSYDVAVEDNQSVPIATLKASVSIGGPDGDTFVFNALENTHVGADTIVNFNKAVDHVELDDYFFNETDLHAAIGSTGSDATHGNALIDLGTTNNGQHDTITVANVTQDYLQQHLELIHLVNHIS
ncbi:MAG TPA: FecR domain-containing protein [Pseudolabrys sp.]|nr:FecR domain-containing protein [Pseudolabrys sp.]